MGDPHGKEITEEEKVLNKQLDELDRALRVMGKNHCNEEVATVMESTRKEIQSRLTILKPVDDRERIAIQRNASFIAGIATRDI